MKYTTVAIMALAGLIGTDSRAAEEPSASRGEIRMAVQNGGPIRELRYRYGENQLRIDRPGEVIPAPPVNLLDLEKGTLSILHPHNGTWEQAPVGGTVDLVSNTPTTVPESIIPAPPVSPPADWPEMPGRPKDLPAGIGPGAAAKPAPAASTPGMPAGIPSGMPAFPAMPDFPMEGMAGDEEPMVLVPQNQTNELFGFSCRLYEITTPNHGSLSIWLTDDSILPPFHLLVHEVPSSHGQVEWDEQVAHLLRKEKMFPLLAELKGKGDDSLAQWRVLSIKTDVKEKDQSGIFKMPEGLHRLHGEI